MSIQNYFDQAQLALAAYGKLLQGALNSAENSAELVSVRVGMSPSQAAQFASRWRVIGAPYHDPVTGVSATVFQEIATGQKTLAIRGTQGPTDYVADAFILMGIPSQLERMGTEPGFSSGIRVDLDQRNRAQSLLFRMKMT